VTRKNERTRLPSELITYALRCPSPDSEFRPDRFDLETDELVEVITDTDARFDDLAFNEFDAVRRGAFE
jgi:hypothetical protein